MFSIVKKFFGRLYHLLIRYLKYRNYESRIKDIQKEVSAKKKKKVVFFVVSIGMWKSNALFRRLLSDPEFEPYIISYLYPKDSMAYRENLQNELRNYFESLNFPFINGYDFKTNQWFNIKAFKPDIVFYAQPYNHGYKGFLLENLWENCLFCYMPYNLNLESNPVFYNHLYQNICWKLYCATEYNRDFEKKFLFNKGKRMVVVGHPLFEELRNRKDVADVWKIKNKSLKRIIWAPHHSILSTDLLSYSNFLLIANDMIKLLDHYKDKVQFAFKPHPRLKTKLYSHPDWGKEKTDEYYDYWNQHSNSILAEGEYIDLFLTSDAMIHDCSSFTCEYLYTEKPVMFISNNNHVDYLNELGKECYYQHYHGCNIDDINDFIQNVINGYDPNYESRCQFKNKFLCVNKDKSSDELIVENMKASLK